MAMIGLQVGSKAARDAIFLQHFHASLLPWVMGSGAILGLGAVLWMGRQMAREGPERVVPLGFALSGLLFFVEAALYARAPAIVGIALYLHVAIFGALLISGFWSIVNERFDPHDARRRISGIGVGAALGGLLGGVLASGLGGWLGPGALLPWLGLSSLATAGSILGIVRAIPNEVEARPWAPRGRALRRPAPGPEGRPSSPAALDSPLRELAATPYLRQIAALVLALAAAAALLDYAMKALAQEQLGGTDALLSLFALLHAASALGALAVQALTTRRLLERLGISASLSALPWTLLIVGGAALIVTRLGLTVLLRTLERVLTNSLFRSAYELLFVPIAPRTKRLTKSLLDVGVHRLGDLLGSALVLLIVSLAPADAVRVALLGSILLAGAALSTTRRIRGGYLSGLAKVLREGMPAPAAEAERDPGAAEEGALSRGQAPDAIAPDAIAPDAIASELRLDPAAARLGRSAEKRPPLDRRALLELALRELEQSPQGSPRGGASIALSRLEEEPPRPDLGLERAFRLLALAYGSETLLRCRQALEARGATTRGAALEYLHGVLPARHWRALTRRAAASMDRRRRWARRTQLDALFGSMETLDRLSERGGLGGESSPPKPPRPGRVPGREGIE